MDSLPLEQYKQLIELARAEDLDGLGDITSQVAIPADKKSRAAVVFREQGILCGIDVIRTILQHYDEQLKLESLADDGHQVAAGQSVAIITGPLRSMLSAERVVLNFLQRLCGIATVTSQYVAAVDGTNARVFDTRKTTPGWRHLEKYAVRCGGGCNHRLGLYDAVMLKDNHLASWVGDNLREKLAAAVKKIKELANQPAFIEVEVDTLDQLSQVLQVEGIDIVLLDNMGPDMLRKAVQMRDNINTGNYDTETGLKNTKVSLEASGNITLSNIAEIARTGVERISTGAITHSVRNLNIALDMTDE